MKRKVPSQKGETLLVLPISMTAVTSIVSELPRPNPLFQSEANREAIDMKMIIHSHANKTHLHKKGDALGLVLKVRGFGTRKWSIV